MEISYYQTCARCHAVYVRAPALYCSRCEKITSRLTKPHLPVSLAGNPRTVRHKLKAAALPWRYHPESLIKAHLTAFGYTVCIGNARRGFFYEIYKDNCLIVPAKCWSKDLDSARSRAARHLARVLNTTLPELVNKLNNPPKNKD